MAATEKASGKEQAPPLKLHRNLGKPCANPSCARPLEAGKVRGLLRTRASCKRWAAAEGVLKPYKPRKRPAPDESAADENAPPQAAWPTVARCTAEPAAAGACAGELALEGGAALTIVDVAMIVGIARSLHPSAVASNKTAKQKLSGAELSYHVEGVFRTTRSRKADVYERRWVSRDDLHEALDPMEELGDSEVYEIECARDLWRGPVPLPESEPNVR